MILQRYHMYCIQHKTSVKGTAMQRDCAEVSCADVFCSLMSTLNPLAKRPKRFISGQQDIKHCSNFIIHRSATAGRLLPTTDTVTVGQRGFHYASPATCSNFTITLSCSSSSQGLKCQTYTTKILTNA